MIAGGLKGLDKRGNECKIRFQVTVGYCKRETRDGILRE